MPSKVKGLPRDAAKAKAKPAAKAKAKSPEELAEELAKKEGAEKLDLVLEEITACYDKDGDGSIERVEFLEGEEARYGALEFGPKTRKLAFQWFKDAGAEGTPTDGMFLSNEKFAEALKKTAESESELGSEKPAELAAWLFENRAKALFSAVYGEIARQKHTQPEEVAKIKAQFARLDKNNSGVLEFDELEQFLAELGITDVKTIFDKIDKNKNGTVSIEEFIDFIFDKPADPSSPGAAAAAAPSYPQTVSFTDLKDKMEEARRLGRNILVLSSGKTEVESFLQYQSNVPLDCKQILGEVLIKKSKPKEEWQEDARKKLMSASYHMGFCKPLWVHLSNTAFDLVGFCSDDGLPADVFASKEVWTVQKAVDMKIVAEEHKFDLTVEDDKKWYEFYVVITSQFDMEKANEHLADKIPHYDDLAILVVDPSSIA